jgi:hypothetical protein
MAYDGSMRDRALLPPAPRWEAPKESFARPRHARRAAPAALALALLAAALPAAADPPSPDAQLASGKDLLKTGQYDAACPMLEASYKNGHRPEALYDLAVCEEGRGHVATAAVDYNAYFALYDRLSVAEQNEERPRMQDAARRREALEPRIPTIKLILDAAAPDGTKVTRFPKGGGDPVEMSVGVPLPVDPGEYQVATQVPGGPRYDQQFTVKPGDKDRPIKLKFVMPDPYAAGTRYGATSQPIAPPLPPLEPGISAWRVSAYTIGGIGVAGILVGIISGAITWGQKGTVSGNCTPPPTDPMTTRLCNQSGEGAADTAHTWGLVSTVTFIAGGALLATGIILLVTEPAPPKLQGSLRGPFIGVTSVDPHGATFGARWAW